MSTNIESTKSTTASTKTIAKHRPLTVNVPAAVIARAKAKSAMQGKSLSSLISDFLGTYSANLNEVVADAE